MPKINDKNYEYKDIKENKGKLALFTKSNIKMNTDGLNNTNNNANNNPIIKFNNHNNNDLLCEKIDDKSNNIQMNLKELSKNIENEINYENYNNNSNNKEHYNIQKIDLKNDKNKYYRCSYKDCNKVFLKQSNLKDHIRAAPGKNPTLALTRGAGRPSAGT